MRPMSLPERGLCVPPVGLRDLVDGRAAQINARCDLEFRDYVAEILRSGFPGFRQLDGNALRVQLDGYIARIVDSDMEDETGIAVRRPATLMAWLRAYAAATSTTTSWEKIRDAASPGSRPARSTVLPYRDALTRMRLLDPVEAWTPSNNQLSRVGIAPKHHLADPALAARLAGLDPGVTLSEGGFLRRPDDITFVGALFESLVAMSLRIFAGTSGVEVRHLRSHTGKHEVDFIVERPDGAIVAIEVKLSNVVNDADVHHLHWLRNTVGDRLVDATVITTGSRAYRRGDGIAVIPLGLLGP